MLINANNCFCIGFRSFSNCDLSAGECQQQSASFSKFQFWSVCVVCVFDLNLFKRIRQIQNIELRRVRSGSVLISDFKQTHEKCRNACAQYAILQLTQTNYFRLSAAMYSMEHV